MQRGPRAPVWPCPGTQVPEPVAQRRGRLGREDSLGARGRQRLLQPLHRPYSEWEGTWRNWISYDGHPLRSIPEEGKPAGWHSPDSCTARFPCP